jgi:hypothetical protein
MIDTIPQVWNTPIFFTPRCFYPRVFATPLVLKHLAKWRDFFILVFLVVYLLTPAYFDIPGVYPEKKNISCNHHIASPPRETGIRY